jgi:hypothetical protein
MSQKKVSIFMGGTGANNAADARALLGAVSLSGDTMTGNLNVAATLITQNVIPDANVTYDLGSSEARFKDLWLSNSTIYLGEASISAQGGNVSFGNAEIQLSNVTTKLNVTNDLFVSGSVEIGTESPLQKLHVFLDNGEYAHFGSTLVNANTEYSGISLGYREAVGYSKTAIVQEQIGDGAARGHLHFLVDINNDGNNVVLGDSKMMIHGTTGKVGIGTTNPGYQLDINSAANALKITTTSASSGSPSIDLLDNGVDVVIAAAGGSSTGLIGTYSNHNFSIYTNNSPKLTVASGGSVGIGTTAPSAKLHVYNSDTTGSIRIGGGNGAGNNRIFIQADSALSYIDSYGDDGFKPLYIWADPLILNSAGSGSVRIRTTTAPTFGSFTNTSLSIKQIADGGAGGGIHIEQNSNENVAFFGFTGSSFTIGTSYRSTGSYQPIEFTTTGLSRLKIGADGIITTPYQPSFSAYLSGAYTHPGGVVGALGGVWATHHNTGGHYSTSTRKFTAPISGVYVFQCIIATEGGAGSFAYLSAELWVNGSRVRIGGWGCGGAGGSYGETASSYVVYMNANDYAEFGSESNKSFNVQNGGGNTIFAGYLLG